MIAMSEPADDQLTAAGLGKMMTLDLCLAAFAAEAPDALAFCDPPNSAALIGRPPLQLTAAQVDRAATRLALTLREMGLRQGETILLRLPNTAEAPVAILGALRAGLVVAPLPLTWREREWKAALEPLAARAVITYAQFDGEPSAEIACALAAAHFPIRLVAAFGAGAPDGVEPLPSLETLLEAPEEGEALPAREGGGDAPALVTFMEEPGGVAVLCRSHRRLLAAALPACHALAIRPGARLLSPMSLSQLPGLAGGLATALLARSALLLHHPFDMDALLETLRAQAPTHLIAPDALVDALAEDAPALLPPHCVRIARFALASSEPGAAVLATFGELALIPAEYDSDGFAALRPGTISGALGEIGLQQPDRPAARLPQHLQAGGQADHARLVLSGLLAPSGRLSASDSGDMESPSWPLPVTIEPSSDPGAYRISGLAAGWGALGGLSVDLAALDRLLSRLPGVESAAAATTEDGLSAMIVPEGVQPLGPEALRAALAELQIAEHKIPDRFRTATTLPRRTDGAIDREAIAPSRGRGER